ncbi:MAG: type I restriction enzyme HsdR N-terminal domain-containing protein [Phocaeicola sp.]|nr:type I restriction enzyme HsdR N-terminal domain-containing protein [Phocaeicola sp.]
MFSLNLPDFQVKIAVTDGKKMVFDPLRRKYVALTPEEWVRQHFVHFLIQHKGYPSGLLANEVQLTLNGTRKRCDTVLYDRTRTPRMIIEYKAPTVPITRQVFDQITRYNIVLKVDYLIVSNGLEHYCCKVDYERFCCNFLKEIPDYATLQTL